jgi:hypothetical protein
MPFTLSELFNPWRELDRRNSELASAESLRDDYKARLDKILARFDHDGDGKPGGSKKRAK